MSRWQIALVCCALWGCASDPEPMPPLQSDRSLLPILRGAPPLAWRRSLYYRYSEFPAVHMVNKHEGVRTDRYKLIEYYSDNEYWEFFDLEEDPNEVNNAYNDPRYAQQIAVMTGQLRETQTMYQDVGTWENLSLPNYTD